MPLAVEGVTVLDRSALLTMRMFVGTVLIPPVALKLGGTGPFARCYTG